jgi:hypothetical protein
MASFMTSSGLPQYLHIPSAQCVFETIFAFSFLLALHHLTLNPETPAGPLGPKAILQSLPVQSWIGDKKAPGEAHYDPLVSPDFPKPVFCFTASPKRRDYFSTNDCPFSLFMFKASPPGADLRGWR